MSRRDVLSIQARRAGTTGRMRGGERSAADEFDRLLGLQFEMAQFAGPVAKLVSSLLPKPN